jgi:signal transduction histidine kinase
MTMLLLTSGAVVAVTAASYCAYEFVTFRRTTVSQLTTLGEVIAHNSTAALAFSSVEDAEQILSAVRADRHIVTAALYTSSGALFARFPARVTPAGLPVAPEADGHRYARDRLELFQPVQRDGKRLGTLYLRSDLNALYERMRLFAAMGVGVIAVAFALAFLMARALQQQISRPILALEETARAISVGQDYSVRAVKLGEDEVGRLTDAFNRMLAQIQQLTGELEHRVLARTAELQVANQELEAFSYSVSHDLRAPLRHIGGFAAMLQAHAGAGLDEKGKRYVGIILDSTKRMGQLIDDLLAFARQSRVEVRRELVALDELVAQVRQGLHAEQAGRRITWTVATLPVVAGDTALLRQVFANLLGNAVKYTRKRDEALVEIGVQPGGKDEAVVFVRDNGAGFDMKYVDKLFGVFQRLHTDDAFEGTGVGLATVRRIVQRHGGRVWAEAQVQVGATFFVALPVSNSTGDPAARKPQPI